MSAFYEAGVYSCQVTGQAMGKSSTGNAQFILRFKVLSAADGRPIKSYERSYYRSITEKTIDYFINDLKALGFTGSSFRLLDPTAEGYENFTGMKLEMNCEHEARDNDTKERWGFARRTGTGAVAAQAPHDSGTMRKLDNLFGKHLRPLARSAAAASPPARSAAPNADADPIVITDDDVPF